MELYTSKLSFDTNLLLNEIKQQYDTSSISEQTPTVTMHNLDSRYQLPKLKLFNEIVLPTFDGLEIDNIFLFFTHSSGKLDWHKDGGHEYRRFIFPIISNEECINWFKINDEEHSMKFTDGVIHWFDSQRIEHTVINGGTTTRVAYLFDMKYDPNKFSNVLSEKFNKNEVF
jgi:hypothetical protein